MGHITIALLSSLLIIANSEGTATPATYRTLFEYPADVLGINDLEGHEDVQIGVSQKSSGDISQPNASDQIDKLRKSIPGEPDVDYPIFRTPPETEFSCHSRSTGYYADVQARCQVFRVCTNTELSGKGFAFLCPNGTLFNQEVFVCDWYQHVDCGASENHYGKNDQLKMKMQSMSDIMAVVTEMMNFPLKDAQRSTLLPISLQSTRPATEPPIFTPTAIPFVSKTQTSTISDHFTSSPSPTLGTLGSGTPSISTQTGAYVTPTVPQQQQQLQKQQQQQQLQPQQQQHQQQHQQQPNSQFGNRVITQEGEFEINSQTGIDTTKTVEQNTFSEHPKDIYVSSVGELSTDAGNKFNIKTSKIIKPDTENTGINSHPLTKEQQLKQLLSQSFRNRAQSNGISSGEKNLEQGLQRILQRNPDYQIPILSGEADLVSFIEQILQRNPDLTADKLNAILSSESDAILEILNEAVKHNQSGTKSHENEILQKIQNILNKYKKNEPNTGFESTPVFGGEADLLQTLRRILQQSQFPIFSGEADLVQFIELLVGRNQDFTRQQLNAIISGEADSILSTLNQKRQQNNGQAIESGEAILLEVIEIILQKHRTSNDTKSSTVPIPSQLQPQAVQSGESDLLENAIRRIQQQSQIPIFSGEADLVSFIEQIVQQNQDFTREQLGAIISGEADSILSILNEKRQQNNGQFIESGEAILLEAIQIVLQKYRSGQSPKANQFSSKVPVQSGESDLLDIFKQIQQQSQIPIFSGEADLVSFIEQIVQQNPDFTREQLRSILSGEINSILAILNQKRTPNNGQLIQSGEAILLEAIQNILQKYLSKNSLNNSQFPKLVPVQSGEGDLLGNVLRQIQQKSQIPIFSGEADLVSFIEEIVQRNRDFTREQLSEIISGEVDSILSILNQKRAQNNGQIIESGEAILLEAIEIVLQKYRNKNASAVFPQPAVTRQPQPNFQVVQSGEDNLLESVLRRIQQQSQIPIFSGEADLVSFIEQIVQQNPDFTREQLGAIISGESDSILSILNEKRQQNNAQASERGEANLLEAIQIVLQKYRNGQRPKSNQFSSTVPVQSGESDLLDILKQIQQQSPIPIFSGEADLVTFIEQIVQQNPDFTRAELSAIIGGELNSILSILNQKRQGTENGETILLDAIQTALQKRRDNVSTPIRSQSPIRTGSLLQNQQGFVSSTEKSSTFSQSDDIIGNQNKIKNGININEFKPVSTIAPKEQGRGASTLGITTLSPKPISQVSPFVVTNTNQNVDSGDSDLLQQILMQILLRIPNQQRPIFSANSNLEEFVQRLKEQNLDFSVNQLTAINGGEANSILRILNDKVERNKPITSADLLESIEQVLFKYRQNNQLLPPLREPVFAGENDLLETIQKIQKKSTTPIYFTQADLLPFIRRIEQQNPKITPYRLNEIIDGGIDSILHILTENREKENYSGFDVIESGEADLLVAIQYYVETYAKPENGPVVLPPPPPSPPTYTAAAMPSQPIQQQQQQQPQQQKQQQQQQVHSGDNDLLRTIQRIVQQSQIPIFSGEADLVTFIELIKQQNPDFTQTQLSTIIENEADSIVQILNQKVRNTKDSSVGTVGVSSGDADLLNAIFQVLRKYRRNNQSTYSYPGSQNTVAYTHESQTESLTNQLPKEVKSNGQETTHSVHGQVATVSSGGTESFYQLSNQNQATAGVDVKPNYSFQQNKQSDFSNQHLESIKSHVTKNVFEGQDNIYTQTAISHKTRSQSTSSNSQKVHYKFTQTVPYQRQSVQLTQSSVSTTLSPNTYIPPIIASLGTQQPPYSFTTTPSSKQVFTYPAVPISQHEETEVRRQSASVNIAKDSANYQLINKNNNNRLNNDAQQQERLTQQAYVHTEIENRPPVNYDIPHPPLRTEYPKSIQNNIESRVLNRPKLRQYSAPSIPSSLPSIVHQPSNNVATIENVPANFASSLNAKQQPYSTLPMITSTYSNRESGNAREKVVVKVVKVPGWYLNDANERSSYFNAVRHGLLNENGLVYVNNVQRENVAHLTTTQQNAPINSLPSVYAQTQTSSIQKPSTPKNTIPSAILQSQYAYPAGYNPIQTYNGINYWPPCFTAAAAAAYSQPIPVSQSQAQTQSQQYTIQK